MPVRGVELATGYITLSVKYAGAMGKIANDVAALENSSQNAGRAIRKNVGSAVNDLAKQTNGMTKATQKMSKTTVARLAEAHRAREKHIRSIERTKKAEQALAQVRKQINILDIQMLKKRRHHAFVETGGKAALEAEINAKKSELAGLESDLKLRRGAESRLKKQRDKARTIFEAEAEKDAARAKKNETRLAKSFFDKGWMQLDYSKRKPSKGRLAKFFIDPFFEAVDGTVNTRMGRIGALASYALFQPFRVGIVGVKKGLAGIGKSAWGAFKGIGSALKGPLAQIAALTAGIGGIGYVISKGFSRIRAIQDAKQALVSLGHSAKNVGRMMESVQKATSGTAFGVTDMLNAAVSAMNEGIDAGQPMVDHLRMVADIAAATGQTVDEVAQTIQRSKMRQDVTYDDIIRLTGPRSPVQQWIQQDMGLSPEMFQKMLSDGKIFWSDVMSSLERHTKGAAAAASQTLTGQLQKLESSLGKLGEAILSPLFAGGGGVLPPLIERLDGFAVAVKEAMPQVVEWLGKAVRGAMELGNWLTQAMRVLVMGASGVLNILARVFETYTALPKPIRMAIGLGSDYRDELGKVAGSLRSSADFLTGGPLWDEVSGGLPSLLEQLDGLQDWFRSSGPKVQDFTKDLADAARWTNALGSATAEFVKENSGTWGEQTTDKIKVFLPEDEQAARKTISDLEKLGFEVKDLGDKTIEVTAKTDEAKKIIDALKRKESGDPLELPIKPNETETRKNFENEIGNLERNLGPVTVPIMPDDRFDMPTDLGGLLGVPPGSSKFRKFHGGKANGVNNEIAYLSQIASSMGLEFTSGVRNEPGSFHHLGQAGDFSNGSSPTPEMNRFAMSLVKNFAPYISELIYSGIPYNIHEGKVVPAIDMPGSPYTTAQAGYHGDHVHVAMKDGAALGGSPQRGRFRRFASGRGGGGRSGGDPTSIARTIYTMARERGYDDHDARSIVAYAVGESGLNPGISGGIQGGKRDPYGDTVIGLFQQKPDFAMRGGIDPSQRADPVANTFAYLNHLEANRHLPIEQALPRTSVGGPLAPGGYQNWAELRRRADAYLGGGGMRSFGPRPANGPGGDEPPPPPLNTDIGGMQHGNPIILDTATPNSTFVNPYTGQPNPFAAPDPWGWGPSPSDVVQHNREIEDLNDRIGDINEQIADLDKEIEEARAALAQAEKENKDGHGRYESNVAEAKERLSDLIESQEDLVRDLRRTKEDIVLSEQEWNESLADAAYSADKYAYNQRGKNGKDGGPFQGPMLPDLGEAGSIIEGGIKETLLPPGFSDPFNNPLVKGAAGILNFVGSLQTDPVVRGLFSAASGIMSGNGSALGSAMMDLIPAPLGNFEPGQAPGATPPYAADMVPGSMALNPASIPGVQGIPQPPGPYGPPGGPLPGPPPTGNVTNIYGPQYNGSTIGHNPDQHMQSVRNNQQAMERSNSFATQRIHK